jgi:superfamily II DNA/RNA helicase
MLDMGFERRSGNVLKSGMTPKEKRQTFMFSATFPAKIQLLASQFLRAYTWMLWTCRLHDRQHTQVLVKATRKREKLYWSLKQSEGSSVEHAVFVQKKRTATWLKNQLNQGGPNDGSEDEKLIHSR